MLKIVTAILLLCSAASAGYVGFASGSQFKATPIEGTVIITCDGFNGSGQATYTCRDVVLEPQNYDVFQGPQGSEATQVELSVDREDGSNRVKVSNYNGKSGKSLSAFNLWVSSLFQSPLLTVGANKLTYSIYSLSSTNARQEYAHGSFTVTVTRNTLRRCQTTEYQSTDVSDCSSQYSICQRYFEQYNSCR